MPIGVWHLYLSVVHVATQGTEEAGSSVLGLMAMIGVTPMVPGITRGRSCCSTGLGRLLPVASCTWEAWCVWPEGHLGTSCLWLVLFGEGHRSAVGTCPHWTLFCFLCLFPALN